MSDAEAEPSPLRRKIINVLLGTAGVGLLAACAPTPDETIATPVLGEAEQAISGSRFLWVDRIGTTPDYLNTNLRALTGSAANPVAVALGFWQQGDGAGGVFVWDAVGGADDGGTVIVAGQSAPTPGSSPPVGPCWRRIYSGGIDARWFGCKCDGTDESLALTRAIAALPVGGKLIIPGVIGLGSTSWTGIKVEGKTDISIVGLNGACGFKNLARPSQTLSIGFQPQVYVFVFKNCQRVELRGLLFDGNLIGNMMDTSLLGLETVSASQIVDCTFRDTGVPSSGLNHAIASYNGSYNVFRQNRIDSCHYATVIGLPNTGCVEQHVLFCDNILTNNPRNGIGFSAHYSRFTGNVITGCDNGFNALSNDQGTCLGVSISGNVMRGNGQGIRNDPGSSTPLAIVGLTVSDNVIEDSRVFGINLSNVHNLIVSGNSLKNNNQQATLYGSAMIFGAVSDVTISNNVVVDDKDYTFQHYGICLGDYSTHAVVANNSVRMKGENTLAIFLAASQPGRTTDITVIGNVVTESGIGIYLQGPREMHLSDNHSYGNVNYDVAYAVFDSVNDLLYANGNRYTTSSFQGKVVTTNGTHKTTRLAAPPTSGPWLLGDIVYNTNPNAAPPNDVVGWVCTATSPLTWKAFG